MNLPSRGNGNQLPVWVSVVVVFTLLVCFVYNLLVNGTDGLAMAYVIAGLLGAYAGVHQLLGRKGTNGDDK